MTENRASETIHFCMAALAGPAAREKLTQTARHTEFWLTHLAARTLYGVHVNGDGRFRSVCHETYVGAEFTWVKAQNIRLMRRSSYR